MFHQILIITHFTTSNYRVLPPFSHFATEVRPTIKVTGKRNSFIGISSVLRILNPFKLRRRARLIFDIYKEYKSLKVRFPINRRDYSSSKTQLRNIKRHGKMIRSQNDLSRPQSEPSTSNDEQLTPTTSRRQKLFGFAKSARDIYIPKISGSVSQLASGVSARAFNNDQYDEDGKLKIPKEASISLMPTYSIPMGDGKYKVDVAGWMSCPGLMTRKNRLIFSLVKQIIKYDVTSNQALQKLESDNLRQDILQENASDNETIASSESLAPSIESSRPSSGLHNHEETLKERLSSFIARYVANAELTIIIGSEDIRETKNLKSVAVLTDGNGCFSSTVEVDYKPSVIQVSATRDETVCSFQETSIIPNTGVAIISDIDDTVKVTGVIGDKRELLNSLLLKDFKSWEIPPVAKWYSRLVESNKLSFHYVSNSPLQLFPTIMKYFTSAGLPLGSMHMKQYTGNIISSLMEPSGSRKRTALTKLATDFSHKKFICVGDSGEYDFESYVDLARRFPGQVLAIYIRYVPNSLSNLDDKRVFDELNRLLATRDKKSKVSQTYRPESIEDLIDLSDTPVALPRIPSPTKSPVETNESQQRAAKLPPMKPRKPTNLKGNPLAPPLPSRTNINRATTASALDEVHKLENPKLPQRPTRTTTSLDAEDNPTKEQLFDHLQNIYYSHHFEDLRDIDERGAQWIERVVEGMRQLQEVDTVVRFFTDEDEDLYETSYEIFKEVNENT
ncbi:hypothetical protein CLIB1444_04S11298 [[Candida] jaroonii]|uniref:Uncharacterized protein n=1 Tax=[Candida] jaroonii TaxID=467808 RepID=A0ACA9Y882_9ASCO|nr:hypothetical protein CLIB1444_04S11298 [[Candida] jaroonii]